VIANGLETLSDTSDLYGDGIENEILTIRTHYENLFLKQGIKINYLSFRLDKNREIKDAHTKK
jgi:tRNA (guanine-N7-)-methyltransferase